MGGGGCKQKHQNNTFKMAITFKPFMQLKPKHTILDMCQVSWEYIYNFLNNWTQCQEIS